MINPHECFYSLNRWYLSVGLAACVWLLPGAAVGAGAPPMADIYLPPGFRIELYAADVPGARSLTLGAEGIVYVGSRSGSVYALVPRTGQPPRIAVIARGLNQPNGVAWHDGALYVAEINRILRYPDIDHHLDAPPPAQIVRDDLPTETWHGWRYIGFGPDGKLYLSIGAPCNVCVPETFRRAGAILEYGSLTRMNADGSHWEVVARGVRNSVGFDWRPGTDELWFTSNGRDWLGDDRPPDTLNRLRRLGEHFGFPYCHAGVIPDPEYGRLHACAGFSPPALALPAHVAALGMRFYRGTMFPPDYRGRLFIAEHGSWNRSRRIGYRVVGVRVDDQGRAGDEEVFAGGWLAGEAVHGRPVDVLVMPDGALLVSDDQAGCVYRIVYAAGG
jgi:glucose/arabinose dehydrogenase